MKMKNRSLNPQAESCHSLRSRLPIDFHIKQDLDDPPVLAATDRATGKSATVWDPNPQLAGLRLGKASVYRWKDVTGKEWIGGLDKPPDYSSGRQYPLVDR